MKEQLAQLKNKAIETLSPLFDRARELYDKLEAREKMIVNITAACLALFIVWNIISFIFSSLSQYKSRFDDEIAMSKKITELIADISASKDKMDEYERLLSRRGATFSLTSFLESQAQDKAVTINTISQPKINEVSDKISEVAVDVQLSSDTRLDKLVAFLSAIEGSRNLLKVSLLNVKPRFDNPQLLEVSLQIRTFDIRTE